MRKNFFLSAILVLTCAMFLVHCGGETDVADTAEADAEESYEAPTREEAAEIIQKSPDYSDFRFTSVTLSIPMKEEGMHEQMRKYVDELEQAGWLRVDSTGTVVLSDMARSDNRWVERPSGYTDIAPLAKKEFVEVTSVERVDGDTVKVDFVYRWIPLQAGRAIESGLLYETMHSDHYATATLENYGGGWQLFIIRPADPPAEETAEESPEETAEEE
ncbi:MAG: hypothetical protein R3338_01245 [Thermoanaerobaculia bacterium]|nr:hypothetical protein [Thermoanaerobaculia bacterium]